MKAYRILLIWSLFISFESKGFSIGCYSHLLTVFDDSGDIFLEIEPEIFGGSHIIIQTGGIRNTETQFSVQVRTDIGYFVLYFDDEWYWFRKVFGCTIENDAD